jgi:hypothetical protein|uniref:Uncharacterized protein n=1 Tax=viral metagenome TaxID=1070528 RepID=A0A6C0INA2_9ZZZZ
MASNQLDNQEYRRALQVYADTRNRMYSDLTQKNIPVTESTPSYVAYMNANKNLDDIINRQVNGSPNAYGNNVEADFKTEMIGRTTMLKNERDNSANLLKQHGQIKGSMINSQRYAEMERFRQSIWLLICGLVIIFATKSYLLPSSTTDVFNTILIGTIIFLVVYVTEHMGTAPMFLIWLILVSMIGTYLVKHVVDRN